VTAGSGRLELARAITSPDNPLTARVLVNRVWMHHFGAGLVATPSDFGSRARPPSHPQLLDWLAATFIERGWSIKQLHREILTSATYQQASGETRESDVGRESAKPQTLDPTNRLLWRYSPRRLEMEAIRDAMLLVAGRLDRRVGGPPTEAMGAGSTRRTIYALVDRGGLPGFFSSFDFPSPMAHVAARPTTTVPQQALFMMNSPFVVTQAEHLAARPPVQGPSETDTRIEALYQLALARVPDPQEVTLARGFLAVAGDEEIAWRQLAQALIMSKEFMFVE